MTKGKQLRHVRGKRQKTLKRGGKQTARFRNGYESLRDIKFYSFCFMVVWRTQVCAGAPEAQQTPQ